MKSFEIIMEEYQNLSDTLKQYVRRYAAYVLQDAGFEEIGTSDINNQIVALYNQTGSFDQILTNYRDYLFT